MFKRLFIHEIKNITRDKMYLFFAVYPFLMIAVAYFLIPYLEKTSPGLAPNIVILLFILLNGMIFGAITAFTLLDDADDQVLLSLKVTPISVKSYVLLKLTVSYIFGVIATLALCLVTGFFSQGHLLDLIYIIILAPLQGPIFALLITAFSSNKVEGFVMMKLSGILILIPIAALFLTKWTELLLSVIPGFWTARIISMQLIEQEYFLGSSTAYFLLGLLVHGIVGYFFFKVYQKKVNI